MRHFPDLSYMAVDLTCSSVKVFDWLIWFLAVVSSEACFKFMALALYPGRFCHVHVFPDLFADLLTIFGPFKLTSLSIS